MLFLSFIYFLYLFLHVEREASNPHLFWDNGSESSLNRLSNLIKTPVSGLNDYSGLKSSLSTLFSILNIIKKTKTITTGKIKQNILIVIKHVMTQYTVTMNYLHVQELSDLIGWL